MGKGAGAAKGTLFEYGCTTKNGDYCDSSGVCGTEAVPASFDLQPAFFAGEPIDDLRQYSLGSAIMSNRLIIRLQRSGIQMEHNDVLTIDVLSSYELARCVRGRVDPVTGNDWDEANCYRANPYGPGRVRIQFDSIVQGDLSLQSTCNANLVATAVSTEPVPLNYDTVTLPVAVAGSWTSWIEFADFGSAAQTDKAPQKRDPIGPKFSVTLGERIYASSFSLSLVDSNLVNAAIHDLPRPYPQIGATLGGTPSTGWFDFNLVRGQGAQFFP